MPKNVIIAIVAILVIGGGAAFYFQGQNKTKTETPQSENGNAITSIKDALSKSISLECIYANAKVGESKTYIKNGKVRSDYMGAQAGQGSVIVTKTKMYLWTADKKGFMMDIPQETADPSQKMEKKETTPSQKEQFLSDLELYKDNCKPAVVSDSLFTPPTDVNFVDYSQMMKPQTAKPQ